MPEILAVPATGLVGKSRVTLDGAEFVLRVRWNSRAQRWVLDLYDAAEAPLALNLVLNVGVGLLGAFGRRADFPAGELIAYDTSRTGAEAGVDDLGTRVRLYYVEAAELA